MHAKRMAKQHKRGKNTPKLNLVSLMDIFTILVFFLLVNSSDVEVLQNNKDVDLPQSIAEKQPPNNLILMVSAQSIIVGGREIVSVEEVSKSTSIGIEKLEEELKYRAGRKPFTTPEQAEKGRSITIMADKSIPYTLIKKIMTASAKMDYRNISLAVNQVADESGEGLLTPSDGGVTP